MVRTIREKGLLRIRESFARTIRRIDALPPEKEVRSIEELLAWLDGDPSPDIQIDGEK